jgi:hypothetical protein
MCVCETDIIKDLSVSRIKFTDPESDYTLEQYILNSNVFLQDMVLCFVVCVHKIKMSFLQGKIRP